MSHISVYNVWKSLDHPNVRQLYDASSATAEPPWYFVSPYLKHGSLLQLLKRVSMRQNREPEDLGLIAERLKMSASHNSYGNFHRMVLKAGDVFCRKLHSAWSTCIKMILSQFVLGFSMGFLNLY